MCDQKHACYLPPPTYAKWAGEREKRHGNRKKVVLVNQGIGVHITNPPELSGSISSEAEPGVEPLETGLKSSMGFGRRWIRLLLHSQLICRPGAEAHRCCEQRGSVLPSPRLSWSRGRSQTLAVQHLFQALNPFENSPTKPRSFLDKTPLSQLVPPAGYHIS